MRESSSRSTDADSRFPRAPADADRLNAPPDAPHPAMIPEESTARACILNSLCRLIEPALARLRETGLSAEQLKWVEAIEGSLRPAEAPLAEQLPAHYLCLTPAELQIAMLVKHHKSNRQIGELMRISRRTVEVHRNNIRRKLGLTRKNVNLRIHLLHLG